MAASGLRAIAACVLCCLGGVSYGAQAATSRPGSAEFLVARAVEQAYDTGDVSSQVLARSLVMYRTAAKGGHVEAMYRLSVCYRFGKGVKPQPSESRRWREMAAWGGHRRAIELTTDDLIDDLLNGSDLEKSRAAAVLKAKCVPALAKLKSSGAAEGKLGYALCQEYGLGGVKKDPAAALACYKELAQTGHVRAIFAMSMRYWNGECGLQKDPIKACQYMQAAAKAGHAEAQYLLALTYFTGDQAMAVKQDYARARALLTQAAEGGQFKAIGTLAWMLHEAVGCKPDPDAAVVWAKRGAKFGDSQSNCVLGECYLKGLGGLPRAPFQAVQHLLQADKASKAWMLLGKCFRDGIGVDADPVESMAWFTKAAEAGNGEALYLLGQCYRYGSNGVKADAKKAFELFTQAAGQSHPAACTEMGNAYVLGDGCKADYLQASKYYMRAASLGDPRGMYSLGAAYDTGAFGITKDRAKAVHWYIRAARAGRPEARKRLAELGVSWKQ
jgi:uncharacterized protein